MDVLKLRLPVTFDVKMDNAECERYFKEQERLRPAAMFCSTAYAESLEYGTGPLKDFQPTYNGGAYTYSGIVHELEYWARIKLHMDNKEECRAFAERVATRMWNYGLYPHIYWRPAVEWATEHLQDEFDKGHSIYEILDDAMRIAVRAVQDNNYIFTGKLLQSLHVEHLDDNDAEDKNEEMAKAVWDARVKDNK